MPLAGLIKATAGRASARTFRETPYFLRLTPVVLLSAMVWSASLNASAQARIEDIFGRSLNQPGITLIDWGGYMANPLIKIHVFPPANAVLPGSANLTANGARLYFDNPSTVSASGPGKTVSFNNVSAGVPVCLSIFPDHDSLDEDYTLTIVFTGANSEKQTNTVPIHVRDLDLPRTNDLLVTQNFDQDITGCFTNLLARAVVEQAADDWACHFAGMNLDPVLRGNETTFIWSNNNDGYQFNNTNTYRGYLLYSYGVTNAAHTSGGQGSYAGPVQSSQGAPLRMKRSGSFASEIHGNYNTLGWLYLTNDNDWLLTGNLGSETNDFYTIAHHEIGHALIFDGAHPGFNLVQTNRGFTSAAVTNYYGRKVAVDSVNHLAGVIDPESGQGAFGYEYFGNIPRKRWLVTKLNLLCAQEVGYTLRSNAAFVALSFPTNSLTSASATTPFAHTFVAIGGIPIYDWDIPAGALPPGLALDRFTGRLAGTPATNGVFTFTVRLRDYRESGPGLTRTVTLTVAPSPRAR